VSKVERFEMRGEGVVAVYFSSCKKKRGFL
jgi:hypothetical protein